MSSFDFMGFGYDGENDKMFVAHAKKYSAAETVDLCRREFDILFQDHQSAYGRQVKGLREPTVEDVQSAHCAFRLGIDRENWPDGCYTLVEPDAPGAFPVWVIDYCRLK